MNSRVFFGILMLFSGIFVGWYVFGNPSSGYTPFIKDKVSSTPSRAPEGGENITQEIQINDRELLEKGGVNERVVVTYTGTGFAPVSVTVKKGTVVTFVNESNRGMWVASGVHPTHQLLPGFDQLSSVANGGVYEYTFKNVGTWKYHNDMNPTDAGDVTVTE